MTSFTRKLFQRDPAAAEAFHRAQQFEHKTTYGRHNMLACFSPAHHPVQRTFGKRPVPPPAVPCPFQQTFCIDNGLDASSCPVCKGDHSHD